MLGSSVIEIAIGLSLIYVLLSLMCTVVAEVGSRAFGRRGAMLKAGIVRLLGDRELTEELYRHALMAGITKPSKYARWKVPDQIPSPLFARILLEVLRKKSPEQVGDLPAIRAAVADLQAEPVHGALDALLRDDEVTNMAGARAVVARWFDDSMQQVSEAYKRQAQIVVFLVAASLAVVLNVDTVGIANRFAQDKTLRERIADVAEPVAQQPAPPEAVEWMTDIDGFNAPIGWASREDVRQACERRKAAANGVAAARAAGADLEAAERSLAVATALLNEIALRAHFPMPCGGEGSSRPLLPTPWLLRMTGWLLTALAASLGARFWFDVLGRLVDVRRTRRVPSKAKNAS